MRARLIGDQRALDAGATARRWRAALEGPSGSPSNSVSMIISFSALARAPARQLIAVHFLHVEHVRHTLAIGIDVRRNDGDFAIGQHARKVRQQPGTIARRNLDHGRYMRELVVEPHPGLDHEGRARA